MANVHVPEDVLRLIFVRIATKSIWPFRCVSKSWHRLIYDVIKLRSRRMILLPSKPLHAIDIAGPGKDIALISPFRNSECNEVTIFGSCNGVVLLVRKNHLSIDMILYNPFTGALKIVPGPPIETSKHSTYAYGFGYGTAPDDLKIVRLKVKGDSEDDSRSCDVLHLKYGSWGPTLQFEDYRFLQYAGTFVNGVLYWIAVGDWNKRVIVAFDLKKMEFSEIQFQCNFPFDRLGTLKGLLCVFLTSNIVDDYELWVMKEDGFAKSWSKVCSIASSSRANRLVGFDPICLLDEGKAVMVNRKRLIIYDILNDSYKEVNMVNELKNSLYVQAMEYVETLVSPYDPCVLV